MQILGVPRSIIHVLYVEYLKKNKNVLWILIYPKHFPFEQKLLMFEESILYPL